MAAAPLTSESAHGLPVLKMTLSPPGGMETREVGIRMPAGSPLSPRGARLIANSPPTPLAVMSKLDTGVRIGSRLSRSTVPSVMWSDRVAARPSSIGPATTLSRPSVH
jgi:hypothetical protein